MAANTCKSSRKALPRRAEAALYRRQKTLQNPERINTFGAQMAVLLMTQFEPVSKRARLKTGIVAVTRVLRDSSEIG
jgi:hypothetical protein